MHTLTALKEKYLAVPQEEWILQPYAGFSDGEMGYDIRVGPNYNDIILGGDRALLNYGERAFGEFIVAAHEVLPDLFLLVEVMKLYLKHMENDNPDDLDIWKHTMGQRWDIIEAILNTLE